MVSFALAHPLLPEIFLQLQSILGHLIYSGSATNSSTLCVDCLFVKSSASCASKVFQICG